MARPIRRLAGWRWVCEACQMGNGEIGPWSLRLCQELPYGASPTSDFATQQARCSLHMIRDSCLSWTPISLHRSSSRVQQRGLNKRVRRYFVRCRLPEGLSETLHLANSSSRTAIGRGLNDALCTRVRTVASRISRRRRTTSNTGMSTSTPSVDVMIRNHASWWRFSSLGRATVWKKPI